MKLTIRRETLAELTTEELAGVAGGITYGCTGGIPTRPLLECMSIRPVCVLQTEG